MPVKRLFLIASVTNDWFPETSSSLRLFLLQMSSSRRRFLVISRELSSQLVHFRYFKAVLAERSMPEMGFRVMEKESRFTKASSPVRSDIPEGGISRLIVLSASR